MRNGRRALAEIALMLAIGLFMGAIGPYGTVDAPAIRRVPYWLLCIVGGGIIGIAIGRVLDRVIRPAWRRVLATSVAMTPFVSLLVLVAGYLLLRQPLGVANWGELLWNVFVISLPMMTVRELAWRKPPTIVETRTVIAPPLPGAEAAFRRRLTAKRRTARLIAIEAHDHYLRVHTDAGVELLTMRFTDALAELVAAHGFRIHRSWWVSADAIDGVDWRRGGGEARLAQDITAPSAGHTHPRCERRAGF